jgi:hypothetical protein
MKKLPKFGEVNESSQPVNESVNLPKVHVYQYVIIVEADGDPIKFRELFNRKIWDSEPISKAYPLSDDDIRNLYKTHVDSGRYVVERGINLSKVSRSDILYIISDKEIDEDYGGDYIITNVPVPIEHGNPW